MAEINESILTSVKKFRGMPEEYTPFDADIILAINSGISVLEQLIDLPVSGFHISDKNSKWVDLLGANESQYEFAKSYICDWVAKLFDAPASSTKLQALNENMNEFAWRLTVRNDKVGAGS